MMPIGIGTLEAVVIIAAAASVAFGIFTKRISFRHWCVAILGCASLGALLTPPDLFSMLLFAIAFAAVYFLGALRYKHSHTAAT